MPLGSPGNPYTTQVNTGGTQTIRNTPEIVAPNISGGNPCLVGISAGGAGPGIGITFGIGYADRGCERRNSAALLNNIGERAAAVALMCQDDTVARAFAQIGRPCPGAAVTAAPAQVVATLQTVQAVDPAVIRRQQAAVSPVPPTPVAQAGRAGGPVPGSLPARPSFCNDLDPEAWARTPVCTGR